MADRTVAGRDVLLVSVAAAGTTPPDDVGALAAAFAAEGWTRRIVVVVERPVPPADAVTSVAEVSLVEVPARVGGPDLRAWPAARLADPDGWQETAAQDDAGLWEEHWTEPVRAAIAEHVAAHRPDLLYVTAPVWSVADAVRQVAAEAEIPYVIEPIDVRPPGLRRGLGKSLGAMTLVEKDVVAGASAVLVPTAATGEWAVEHPDARLVARPLLACDAPLPVESDDPRTAGPIAVLGGVSGSAPLGELMDAWQLAGAPGKELLWWGAEPVDRSQRAMLDEAAALGVRRVADEEQDAQPLTSAALVVALLGDRQGLPRGTTTALAAGTPVLVVAEADHPAIEAASALRGTVVTAPHADLVAQVLASPPPRGAAAPDAVAADVAAAWRDLVRALLVTVAG